MILKKKFDLKCFLFNIIKGFGINDYKRVDSSKLEQIYA